MADLAPINSNAPKRFTMVDMLAHSGMYNGLARSCRYAVQIIPKGKLLAPVAGPTAMTQDLMYLCEVADMPGRSFERTGARYYGPQEYFPVLSVYDEMQLTFLCRNKSFERQYFDNWMTLINPVHTYDFNYRDDYAADIDIYTFDDTENAIYNITIMDAYPSQLMPQPLTWADDNFQRLVVSFTYVKWTRKGLDPVPGVGEGGYSYSLVKGKNVSARVR